MNRYSAYPHRVPGMATWWAMLRVCRDAHPSPILDRNGKPKTFPTKGEAAEECLKHLVAFMNGRDIRGEVFEGGDYTRSKAAKSQANRIFKRSEGAAA